MGYTGVIIDENMNMKFVARGKKGFGDGALLLSPGEGMLMMDLEHANQAIKYYGESCKSTIMGKTDFMLIYPEESEIRLNGDKYLVGECLMMKSARGLELITKQEVQLALKEFLSRVTVIRIGLCDIPAYRLD